MMIIDDNKKGWKMSSITSAETSLVKPNRNLTLWGAVGLSLGIVAPSLAMSGNGQGTAAVVGKAVPLIFVLGAIGITLVSHGFIRLTQRYNQAGSAYALVGMTVGPRAGFFSGFGVMLTYALFALGNIGAVGSFVDSFIANAQGSPAHPFKVPWIVSGLIAVAMAAVISTREFRNVVKILLIIEGIGVVSMLIVSLVILGKGGASHTGGLDFSTFNPKGQSFTVIMGAVVGAFLSWSGFEGSAALGEETSNPSRNIPLSLLGVVAGTSVLFIIVMFAQTVGFGTNAAGIKAFSTSGNSLAQLGHSYIGLWFSLVLSFTAIMSAFGCLLGSAGTAGRLLFAFSRDGVGPSAWGRLDKKGEPTNALAAIFSVIVAVAVISFISGHPVLGSGDPALDAYFYFSTIGAICLMVSYFMVELGTVLHLTRERKEKIAEVIIPVLGGLLILSVFYFNVKSQVVWTGAPFIAFGLMAIGLVIAWAFPGLATKVFDGLNRTLPDPGGKELSASSGPHKEPFPTAEV